MQPINALSTIDRHLRAMFVRIAFVGFVALTCAAPSVAHDIKDGVPVTDANGHVHRHTPGPAVAADTGVSSPDDEIYDTQTMTGSIAQPAENDLLPVPGPATLALPEPAVIDAKPKADVKVTAPAMHEVTLEPIKKKKKLATKKPEAKPAKLATKEPIKPSKRKKVKPAENSAPTAASESLY
jgi:hypothetical protein